MDTRRCCSLPVRLFGDVEITRREFTRSRQQHQLIKQSRAHHRPLNAPANRRSPQSPGTSVAWRQIHDVAPRRTARICSTRPTPPPVRSAPPDDYVRGVRGYRWLGRRCARRSMLRPGGTLVWHLFARTGGGSGAYRCAVGLGRTGTTASPRTDRDRYPARMAQHAGRPAHVAVPLRRIRRNRRVLWCAACQTQ